VTSVLARSLRTEVTQSGRGEEMGVPGNEVLSYIAGYFDGEACISLLRLDTLKLGIVSGDREVLELIARTFGGSVWPERRRYCGDERWYYRWRVNNGRAQAVLRELLPFLVAKREIARRACELDFVPRGAMTPEMREARCRFKEFLVQCKCAHSSTGSAEVSPRPPAREQPH